MVIIEFSRCNRMVKRDQDEKGGCFVNEIWLLMITDVEG